ncbi:MAG: hypothetical protein N2483_06240 [Burkholderiaceae bacterium]|nr:hypothetical protein [Burkholderiaceae bacterium]
MSFSPFGSPPRLRLALMFFSDEDQAVARELVAAMYSDVLPWVVADSAPFEAMLFARGPRHVDADELAILRLAADAERYARHRYGDAMPPIALRKPLRPTHLKLVLEMAAMSLIPEHIARFSPQTQPRAARVRPLRPLGQ